MLDYTSICLMYNIDMPTYDYFCTKCDSTFELIHSIKDESSHKCPECHQNMERLISGGFTILSGGLQPTIQDHKEQEHKKKVKDFDRAVKMRKKAFGSDAVGNPNDKPNPKHIIKKGRTLGGQQMEIDRQSFIKAAAKDNVLVKKAQDALKKNQNKKHA